MGIEVVSIIVGGMRYTAFETIEMTAAINEGARSFRFEVAAELGASATNSIFRVGAKVEVYANDDLVCRGFVDQRQPSFEANSAIISVAGRSNSGDLIDGSAVHKTGRFEKKDPKEIGTVLAHEYDGTTFTTDQQLDKVDHYQITPGESVYRCVEKLARQQGCTLSGTADGNIKITKAGKERHAGGLVEGANILKGSADHNGANRHSKYIVRGQRPFEHGKDNLEIEAAIRESGVDRHRPVIVIEDEDTTKDLAKKRAKGRRDRAAGNALKATITVQGFRDEAGKLWEPGHLIWTESPFLDVAQDMLIESVQFSQSERGSTATLKLTDPRSYGGKGGKGNKSGKDWTQSDGDDWLLPEPTE